MPGPAPASSRLLLVATLVGALVILAGGGLSWLLFAEPPNQSPFAQAIGGVFSLVDQDGKTVTDRDLRGKWLLVYFGYTHCADLCPTALSQMTSALDQLGDAAKYFQPIFVSIDPERDRGPALRQYTQSFDDRLVGLTGTTDEIERLASTVGVSYNKVLEPGDDYVIDHAATLTLIAPDLRHATTFKLGESYRIAATLVAALDRAGVPIAGANNIGAYR